MDTIESMVNTRPVQYDRRILMNNELTSLRTEVIRLDGDLLRLKNEFMEHCTLDEKTHFKMLEEMLAIQKKMDLVVMDLAAHVAREESKLDHIEHLMVSNQQELVKWISSTDPVIKTYNAVLNWANISKGISEFFKWFVPICVGIVGSILYFNK